MEDLKELLKVCIKLNDEFLYLALDENLDQIRVYYSAMSDAIREIYMIMMGNQLAVSPTLLQKMEEVYEALHVGDCIRILDITKFEMRPILQQYLESIGD